MLTKKERRRGIKLMQQEINQQLFDLHCQAKTSLEEISIKTGMPDYVIDALEHTSARCNLGNLISIASFYNKHIKVEIVDLPKEI